METVNNESNLSDANDQVYSYYQLENAKKFISDVTTSLLLKQALICWTENCVAPESAEQFEKVPAQLPRQILLEMCRRKGRIETDCPG